jgi:hypothetical protein
MALTGSVPSASTPKISVVTDKERLNNGVDSLFTTPTNESSPPTSDARGSIAIVNTLSVFVMRALQPSLALVLVPGNEAHWIKAGAAAPMCGIKVIVLELGARDLTPPAG